MSGAAKVVKSSDGKSTKGTSTPVKNVNSSGSVADVGQFVEEILQKTSQLLLSEVNKNVSLSSNLSYTTSCIRLKNGHAGQGREYKVTRGAAGYSGI